jgi:ubiquinone/menaquinone biosynthesis C-methylase UbiE
MDVSARELPLAPNAVRAVYRRRAPRYDLTSRLYRLLGFRVDHYREEGVERLQLRAGDTVVELGCGTGANFDALERRVGPGGHIIGVDLTDSMLEQARARVAHRGWTNVELVLSDAGSYRFPEAGVDGVLATYALTLFPAFDEVIRRSARALRSGRRLVIVDFKAPDGWPPWLLRTIVPLLRPFGVTLGLADRKPWLSVERHLSLLIECNWVMARRSAARRASALASFSSARLRSVMSTAMPTTNRRPSRRMPGAEALKLQWRMSPALVRIGNSTPIRALVPANRAQT